MVATLRIASHEVTIPETDVLIGKYHAYIIYDENLDENDDYETNTQYVKILRGGAPYQYGSNGIIAEAYTDVTDSEDWEEAQVASNLTSLSADWSSMWAFAGTMGGVFNSGVYDTNVSYGLTFNSNSVINTLLNVVGLNYRENMPTGTNSSQYTGHMGLLDGDGNSIYTAYINDDGTLTFPDRVTYFSKRGGDDTIILQSNISLDEHAKLELIFDSVLAGDTHSTTVLLDNLDYADVNIQANDTFKITKGSEDLVSLDNFHTDSLGDNLAFQFDDVTLFVGDNDNDTLNGSQGNDIILSSIGGDNLDGGFGFDTAAYDVSGNTQAVTIDYTNIVNGYFSVTDGFGDVDILTAIENITATGTADTLLLDGNLLNNNALQLNVDGLAGFDTVNLSLGTYYIDGNKKVETAFGSTITNFERIEVDTAKIYSAALGNSYYFDNNWLEISYIHSNVPNGITFNSNSGTVSGATGTDIFSSMMGSISGLNSIRVDGTNSNDHFILNNSNAVYGLSGFGGNDLIELGSAGLSVGYEYVSGTDTFTGDSEISLSLKLPSGISASQVTGQYINVVEDNVTEVYDDPIDENSPPVLSHIIREYTADYVIKISGNDAIILEGQAYTTTDYVSGTDSVSSATLINLFSPNGFQGTLAPQTAGFANILSSHSVTNAIDTTISSGYNLLTFGSMSSDNLNFTNYSANNFAMLDDGDDIVTASNAVAMEIYGEDGNDTLIGGVQNDILRGGAGDDDLIGGAGDDYLSGDAGDDTFTYIVENNFGNTDQYWAGAGSDTLKVYMTQPSFNFVRQQIDYYSAYINEVGDSTTYANGNNFYSVEGLSVADFEILEVYVDGILYDPQNIIIGEDIEGPITTTSSGDVVYGTSESDVIYASLGGDYINGLSGVDVIDYSNVSSSASIDLSSGAASHGANNDTLVNIENVNGSDFSDNITGDSNGNTLAGLEGDDVINAGAGDDVIVGGLGDDTLTGDAGADTFLFNDLTEITANTDHITDFFSDDQIDLSSISSLSFIGFNEFSNEAGEVRYVFENGTTAIEIDSTGDGVRDHRIVLDNGEIHLIEDGYGIIKVNPNNVIVGTTSSDNLSGAASDDIFYAYEGNDILDGTSGEDTSDYSASASRVIVDLENNTASDGYGYTDTLTSIENIRGSNFGDNIIGDSNDNVLEGLDGNDELVGGAGNDDLIGGAGSDILDSGAGDDVAIGNSGDDLFTYRYVDNIGSTDSYFGGTGSDRVNFYFTSAEYTSAV